MPGYHVTCRGAMRRRGNGDHVAQVRLVFREPQQFDTATVTELTVEADRLVLAQGGSVVLDVAADSIALIDHGNGGRLERLRAKHPNHGKSWTAMEDAKLRELHGQGVGMADLAHHFGRSRGAVRSALQRLNLIERTANEPRS